MRIPQLILIALLAALSLATSAAAATLQSGDVLVVEATQRRVILVSAADGARSVVTISPLPAQAGDAVLSRDRYLFVVIGGATPGVVRVDPVSGGWSWLTTGGQLVYPVAIATDRDGALLVVESNSGGSVVRVDPVSGAQSTAVPASAALHPAGIVVLSNGDLLLSSGNRIVRWSRPSGIATTFASGADLLGPGQMTLQPATGRLIVCCYGSILDSGVLVVMNASTGARFPALTGFNPLADVTAALDGGLDASEGGTTIWHQPLAGPLTALASWGGGADPLDPSGTNRYYGLAVVDGPTAARTTSWGRLKRLYRP